MSATRHTGAGTGAAAQAGTTGRCCIWHTARLPQGLGLQWETMLGCPPVDAGLGTARADGLGSALTPHCSPALCSMLRLQKGTTHARGSTADSVPILPFSCTCVSVNARGHACTLCSWSWRVRRRPSALRRPHLVGTRCCHCYGRGRRSARSAPAEAQRESGGAQGLHVPTAAGNTLSTNSAA